MNLLSDNQMNPLDGTGWYFPSRRAGDPKPTCEGTVSDSG
jgi:hypothetical protein